MTSLPDSLVRPEDDLGERTGLPWRTVVWNDPVNLMSYVSWVFRSYFNVSAEKAEHLMLQVHNEGRATVSSGAKESMERDVLAMQSYGLWATMENSQ